MRCTALRATPDCSKGTGQTFCALNRIADRRDRAGCSRGVIGSWCVAIEPLIRCGRAGDRACVHIAEAPAAFAGYPVPIVDGAEATAAVAGWIADERVSKASMPGRQLELLVTDPPANVSVAAGRFLSGDASVAMQVDLVACRARLDPLLASRGPSSRTFETRMRKSDVAGTKRQA